MGHLLKGNKMKHDFLDYLEIVMLGASVLVLTFIGVLCCAAGIYTLYQG